MKIRVLLFNLSSRWPQFWFRGFSVCVRISVWVWVECGFIFRLWVWVRVSFSSGLGGVWFPPFVFELAFEQLFTEIYFPRIPVAARTTGQHTRKRGIILMRSQNGGYSVYGSKFRACTAHGLISMSACNINLRLCGLVFSLSSAYKQQLVNKSIFAVRAQMPEKSDRDKLHWMPLGGDREPIKEHWTAGPQDLHNSTRSRLRNGASRTGIN